MALSRQRDKDGFVPLTRQRSLRPVDGTGMTKKISSWQKWEKSKGLHLSNLPPINRAKLPIYIFG